METHRYDTKPQDGSQVDTKVRMNPHVAFDVVDKVQNSKDRRRFTVLIFLGIFLVATVVLGGIATADVITPWWKQQKPGMSVSVIERSYSSYLHTVRLTRSDQKNTIDDIILSMRS